MQVARLEALVEIVLTCLEQLQKRGTHRQKVYADMSISHVRKEIIQLIEQFRKFLQI